MHHLKKFKYCMLALFFILSGFISAKNKQTGQTLEKSAGISELPTSRTLCNINNWSYWLYNDGTSAIAPDGKAGGIYPRGKGNVVYRDGLVWGAWVNGRIQVGGQTFRTGTQPVSDHIYRIRRDWISLTCSDVVQEAEELNQVPVSAVTDSMLEQILFDYRDDWKNWPVEQGAPYVDVNQNGIYDPVRDRDGYPNAQYGDYPGIDGADQVIWFKVNDLDGVYTSSLYGSDPLGIELQVTVWAYNKPETELDQTIFKKYKIKNLSTDKPFKEMYLSQWMDTDLGYYGDDLAGCDSVLNCTFTFNGGEDKDFLALGQPTPAMAYVLLQGPIVASVGDSAIYGDQFLPGYRNLPMTSFTYYAAGSTEYDDPSLGSYQGALEWYNLLRGYEPTADIDHPISFHHLNAEQYGQPTKYPLNGDPVKGTGDVDGRDGNTVPSFRHMAMVSGPFDLAPGETQEMVVALVGGQGTDYLNSVQILKGNIKNLYNNYANLTILLPSSPMPEKFELLQNFPNPFNAFTQVPYRLSSAADVELSVYNLLGQKVRTLVKERQVTGTYVVSLNASSLASGVYFYRLNVDKVFAKTRKLILLK